MKKLQLNLSDLEVNSFETEKAKASSGTVKGNDINSYDNITCYQTCGTSCYQTCEYTCGSVPTCYDTCANTCGICLPTYEVTCPRTAR